MSTDKPTRWYPGLSQLSNPAALERSFRQLLNQHYALQDAHSALLAKVNSAGQPGEGAFPAGSGPTDSLLLGLRVQPVDVNTLADGAALKFSKKSGNFQFS